MWNSRNHTAMAVVGVGLAVAVASPSSAHRLGGAYGYAGGCGAFGAYGYAPAAYGGVYTYGWPYGVIGDVNYPTYGYAAGCGYSTYGYASGHGPYGYAPNYGFAGGCGALTVLTATRRTTASPVSAGPVAITAIAVMRGPL
jgi:hypothetical protein